MNQDIRQILANNIKNLRTQKKLSREELSLVLGVDNSYISKLEKGKINITLDKIEMLATKIKLHFLHISCWTVLNRHISFPPSADKPLIKKLLFKD